MHVLLIEPDKLSAATYRDALQRDGHTVVHVVSAQAAVHAADTHMPDVVVLELQLPNHNGVEFLYEFSSYHEWRNVPVIIHTFVPSHELAHGTTLRTDLGVVRVLYKPETNLAKLRRAVRAVAPAAV